MRVREGEVKNRCRALRGEPHLLFSLSALEKTSANFRTLTSTECPLFAAS